jgi:hypothetical protein
MAEDSCVKGTSWRLRSSGNPQMICADNSENCECAAGSRNQFVLQSFGVEVRETKTWQATQNLPASTEFIGLNPDAELESASFNATVYTTLDGQLIFQGQEVGLPTYEDESVIPGVDSLFT